MCNMNQVSSNEELLHTSKDCFQFVTKFFEVINVSAAHIYHSALELCPLSSIVRKLYYIQRINPLPRVVVGTSASWNQTIAISSKNYNYMFCAWSPCGQFVATQTQKAVEVRNQLTLELSATLLPPETTPQLMGPLAYSPDGYTLACASNTAIVIWDVQTGGVAQEIKCGISIISLVWSLCGEKICTIEDNIVHVYSVVSGRTLSCDILQSRDNLHLWAHNKSFQVMTTKQDEIDIPWQRLLPHPYVNTTINIFEVGSSLTKIRSLSVSSSISVNSLKIGTFSPATSHFSILVGYGLQILSLDTVESGTSMLSFPEIHNALSHCFSSDGSLFAASQETGIHIWKFGSKKYTPWRTFQCQGWSNSPLQFSPTSSSILGPSGNILQVWYLDGLSTALEASHQQFANFSHSGTHIATAHKLGSTITIISLLSQTPSQIIDTDQKIEGLVITGNVLLVAGSGKLVAWLLTEEGLVDGAFSNRRANHSDSIWAISLPHWHPELWVFSVQGQTGVIKPGGNDLHIYHTTTGEVLQPGWFPQHSNSHWYHLGGLSWGQHYLSHHNLSQYNTPPEVSWEVSQTTLQEGWIRGPEGKHRLWIPVEWRMSWEHVDWLHDTTTLHFSIPGGSPIIIKF